MEYLSLVDKRVTDILVLENGEAMTHLPPSKLLLDHEVELGYNNEFRARESVVERLIEAAEYLPEGVFLSIKETFRPAVFQRFIFNRRLIKLFCLEENVHQSSDSIRELAAQYIAPPEVAGHPTGGAVDVSLVDAFGKELDLGCAYDDDPVVSEGKCYSFCKEVSAEATRNRALLFGCMEKAGFVNYPFEWWHWSYGDKYWAAVKEMPHALYSPID
ncbi:M15 family metallopeptidase [Vibrio harveyi]|uniref:M15 family metallopeptidase n=1 Tax=Vibrio harveyi TaxID=669 RepID=UPI003BB79E39